MIIPFSYKESNLNLDENIVKIEESELIDSLGDLEYDQIQHIFNKIFLEYYDNYKILKDLLNFVEREEKEQLFNVIDMFLELYQRNWFIINKDHPEIIEFMKDLVNKYG